MNILITGAKGQLGQEFKRLKDTFDGNLILTDLDEIDICSTENINDFLSVIELDYIVNCAAYTNVRDAEIEREKSLLINSFGVKNLVNYCEKKKIKLIHISTDYVYNSKSIDPTDEMSNINPINYYGLSKREGEKHIEESKSESIIIRTSWLYSKFGKNFVNTIIDKCVNKSEINVPGQFDQYQEKGIFLWDIAAGLSIIKAAGGNYTFKSYSEDQFKVDVVANNNCL